MSQSNAIDIAYKKWKREHPKEYDRFQKWTKAQLKKQNDIDRFGYAFPERKVRPHVEREMEECPIYKTYNEDHLCDICHIDSCPHCTERLVME